MLPEFPSAARVSEFVCNLEYLFSRMNLGSYGAKEPHLWLMSRISARTWDDRRTASERGSRTYTYDELVDLLMELALERENDSLKVLPWVVEGAGGLGAGKTSGAGTRGVDLNAAVGDRTGYTDTNGGESSNNGSKIHADCYPAENPSL